jgi:hypothetical protein
MTVYGFDVNGRLAWILQECPTVCMQLNVFPKTLLKTYAFITVWGLYLAYTTPNSLLQVTIPFL